MYFQTGSHNQPSSTRLNVWEFEGSAAQNWPTAVFSLPEWIIKFALNAVTDTPPQYANLCRWKKLSSPWCQLCGEDQSLAHILNSCWKALNLRRYTTRHDDVLKVDIFDFSKHSLTSAMRIIADLHLPPEHCPHEPTHRHCHLEHFSHPPCGADSTFRNKHR